MKLLMICLTAFFSVLVPNLHAQDNMLSFLSFLKTDMKDFDKGCAIEYICLGYSYEKEEKYVTVNFFDSSGNSYSAKYSVNGFKRIEMTKTHIQKKFSFPSVDDISIILSDFESYLKKEYSDIKSEILTSKYVTDISFDGRTAKIVIGGAFNWDFERPSLGGYYHFEYNMKDRKFVKIKFSK